MYITPQDVISHYGNGTAERPGSIPEAAVKLGLTRQTLHVWLRKGVPLDWQHWIERDTAGRFKADPRRPNDPLRKNHYKAPAVHAAASATTEA